MKSEPIRTASWILLMGAIFWMGTAVVPSAAMGDEQETATPAQVAPAALQPMPRAVEPKFVVRLKSDAWLRVSVDGMVMFEGRVPRDAVQEWKPSKFIGLRTTEPGALELSLNGQPVTLGARGPDGEYRIESTETTNSPAVTGGEAKSAAVADPTADATITAVLIKKYALALYGWDLDTIWDLWSVRRQGVEGPKDRWIVQTRMALEASKIRPGRDYDVAGEDVITSYSGDEKSPEKATGDALVTIKSKNNVFDTYVDMVKFNLVKEGGVWRVILAKPTGFVPEFYSEQAAKNTDQGVRAEAGLQASQLGPKDRKAADYTLKRYFNAAAADDFETMWDLSAPEVRARFGNDANKWTTIQRGSAARMPYRKGRDYTIEGTELKLRDAEGTTARFTEVTTLIFSATGRKIHQIADVDIVKTGGIWMISNVRPKQ